MRSADTVYLVDADNTLLDNDRIQQDLSAQLTAQLGEAGCARYWQIYEHLFAEHGHVDYFGALQQLRREAPVDPRHLAVSQFLFDYPFAERLYDGALATLQTLGARGTTVVLTDGDIAYQLHKLRRAGLWDAVDGRVVIAIHKEDMAAEVTARFPAQRYVIVEDKLRILGAMKRADSGWPNLTSVFVRQGRYAVDPAHLPHLAAADHIVERVAEVAGLPV